MNRSARTLLAAMIVAAAGWPRSVWAQEGEAAPAAGAAVEGVVGDPALQPAASPPASGGIRFTFKDASFDFVLDFIARETGLPVIREAPVPAGTMTFIGASAYSFDEAMTIINLILQPQGVHLRREGNFLYLATLANAATRPGEVVQGSVPATTPPDKFVTLAYPLNNARAELLAEQIKPMIGPNGRIVPVPAQNLLLVVESAAQCRRMEEVIRAVDTLRPVDSAFRLFPLKHAKAEQVAEALKGLIGERTTQVFVDKDGRQTRVQEVTVEGLNLQADPRTNSVIAVGAEARIQTVEELIALLDVPESASGSNLMTFALVGIDAVQAQQHLSSLFSNVPGEKKPTLVPLPAVGKITVVGSPEYLAQAAALIGAIDPEADAGPDQARDVRPERVSRTIALSNAAPERVRTVAEKLLSARQLATLKSVPTLDGRSLLVVGPEADVEAYAALVAGLDTPNPADRDVRLVQLTAENAKAALDRAGELYAATGRAELAPVSATLDEPSRTATLIGPREGVEKFVELLNAAQAREVVELETRTYRLSSARPSELSAKAGRLARAMLAPSDGSTFREPAFEALDELGTLLVRAKPAQFAVLEALVKELDVAGPGAGQMRIVKLGAGDPEALARRAMELYDERARTMPASEAGPVATEVDAASGSVLIRGTTGGVAMYASLLDQVQQLVPPARTSRLVEVRNAEAGEVRAALLGLWDSMEPVEASRVAPPPSVQVIERSNALLVTAEASQHELARSLIERLDTTRATELPPLRLVPVRSADVQAVASMLTENYAKRAPAERSAKPVDVRADAATGTLIVSAPAEIADEIRALVDELNKERPDADGRVTQLFPLKIARAVDVASAMDRLYPQPPMPVDRLGRPQPWLQKPKEVTVSADGGSNSLIIDAPASRMESIQALAEKLDRVELPPQAELKTYQVVGADLSAIARTLGSMAQRGILSAPAQPGRAAVQVVIETEPKSSTLIVAGDATTFATVERMLQDLSAVPVEKALRVVPISGRDAAAVRDRALEVYNAQIAQIPGANPIEISVDETTNSLMVVADAEAMRRFERVIEELQRQAGPARELRLIELRFAKAAEVKGFLDDLVASTESFRIKGGADPVFETIEATNQILVAAQPAQLPLIEGMIKGLDSRRSADRPPLRILSLRTTDASNLASVLRGSYDRRSVEERATHPVDVQADAATNTLLVSAHPDVLPEIEKVVTELNEAEAIDGEGREIRIFPLAVARAEELARTIDEMFPEPPMPVDRLGRPQPHLREKKEVFVRADRGTNSLIVDAPGRRLAGFEQIVRALDQRESARNVELRSYRVERADLGAAAEAIRGAASSGALHQAGGASSSAPVTVSLEPRSRTLVVTGPKEVFAAVEEILSRVDAAPDLPATIVRLHALEHARAERLQPMLHKLLLMRLREQREREGKSSDEAESLLDVAADPSTNTLIISAPEPIHGIADELLKVLDAESAASGRNVLRVVPLMYADAVQVAQNLSETLPSLDLPGGVPSRILPVAGSNAILLVGPEASLTRIEKDLVSKLDVRATDADAQGVETFALTHADAGRIASMVQNLLVEQQLSDPRILLRQLQYTRGQIPRQPSVRVEADERTNALVISAPSATLELARSVIARLDQPASDPDRVASTFTPARAAPAGLASAVARIVSQTLPGGRRGVELSAEPATGAIVVIGGREQVDRALELLKEFDAAAPVAPSLDLSILDLAHADASAVAPIVARMLSDRARWPAELVAAERAGLAIASPSVTADPEGNRLVVSAPTALSPMARELVATLDRPASATPVDVRVFRLTKAAADDVGNAVRAALSASATPAEPEPVVTAEPGSNSLVVAGSVERLAQAQELVASMDQASDPQGPGVRTIFLKHARAEAIVPVIEKLMVSESMADQLPQWARAEYLIAREGASGRAVRVTAERRLNAIVVSAPPVLLDLAEQVVSGLDQDAASSGADRLLRVITLKNADASQLLTALEGVIDADDGTGEEPATIRVDAQSNSLVVRAGPDRMHAIEELAARLDEASIASSRQIRMIPLDRSKSDARAMAETIRRLLEQQPGVKVEIIRAEDLARPEGPDDDDDPPGPGRPTGRAPLRSSHPAHASVPLVTALAASALGVQPETPPASETANVTIAVDPRTNSLIVVGPPRLGDRVRELALALESQMPAEPTMVRVVTIPPGADADAIAQVLNQTARQVGRRSEENPGGFTGVVSAAADPSDAAVIVWANSTDFEAVGPLIGALASPGPGSSLTVKVYALERIGAEAAAGAIADLFSAAPRGSQSRRLRSVELSVVGPDGNAQAGAIDPALVRVIPDPSGRSLIVAAPASGMGLIDRFVAMLDQSEPGMGAGITRHALAHARAAELAPKLQQLFATKLERGRGGLAPPTFVADERTNAIMVTGSTGQQEDAARLIATMDAPVSDDGELAILTLQNATPSMVERVVRDMLIGPNPARAESIRISAEDDSNLFVVRASAEDLERVRAIVDQVDTADAAGLPVRAIKLTRADAQAVASSIQNFFRQRAEASSRPGQRVVSRVAIAGDRNSGTIMIASSDEDYEQATSLAEVFDAPSVGREIQTRVIPLKHARTRELESAIGEIGWEISSNRRNQFYGGFDGGNEDRLIVNPVERANAFVAMGTPNALDLVERVIRELDVPEPEQARAIVRAVPVEKADIDAIAAVVERALAPTNDNFWWWDASNDPDAVKVEVDRQRRLVILIGKQPLVERGVAYINELATTSGRPGHVLESFPVKFAQADRAANSLRRFFRERAEAQGLPEGEISIVGSPDGNVVLVSADPESMETIRGLLAELDQPEDLARATEFFVLENAKAAELAPTIQAHFPRSGRADQAVTVTAQASTNALVVSAPTELIPRVQALVAQLDGPPTAASIQTVQLKAARAEDVAASLKAALPASVNVTVTAVRRTNSLMLSGSEDGIAFAMEQVRALDRELEVDPIEFRRVQLKNALARDVAFTLRMMMRARPAATGEPDPSIDYVVDDNSMAISGTRDQIDAMSKIIEQLDTPSTDERTTDFVKLEFANAEQTAKALEFFYGRNASEARTPGSRSVSIVADPASNSLVVSAPKGEWEGIRALLKKLDTKDYDTSRQLQVIALKHADATSVARALNEGFRVPLEDQFRREQAQREQESRARRGNERDEPPIPPTVLVDAQGMPAVSAEPRTNSLIVFAEQRDLKRITALVEQMDVPAFAGMPDVRVVPLRTGKASDIARSLRALFSQDGDRLGPRSIVIFGDDASNTLVVRADEPEFAEIKALAETLQQEGDRALSVQVLPIRSLPAARLQRTLLSTFQPVAERYGESLAIEIDRDNNALVVASSERLFEEIRRVASELDAAIPAEPGAAIPPALGQTVLIIDVQNNAPVDIVRLLEQIGVTQAQAPDRPGVVAEPVRLFPLLTRSAIAVVGSPPDGVAIAALVKSLDTAPVEPSQSVSLVRLKTATASAMVSTLESLLKPGDSDGGAGPATALAEHVRRLSVARNDVKDDIALDLTKPIRLLPDSVSNSILVASTPENVRALADVIGLLDTLPVGDAVVVRIFPLENASARRLRDVIRELFSQGENLRRLPGTQIKGLPPTATGQALAGEIAISVDERTESLVVAGREEAVAFVEVLVKQLDSDEVSRWVEVKLLPLQHADAASLADLLRDVLVRGLNTRPESLGLQQQIGRLRMGVADGEPIHADLFSPLTGLAINAAEDLNALILVGSQSNIAIVEQLVGMLDVEAASAANTVRVYPLTHAAADRVAEMVADIFRQRQAADSSMRDEDRVVVRADSRTNSLIVSTSPRSFAILEAILKNLDAEEARFSVKLHVIPITNADARQLAPRIDKLMRDRIAAGSRGGGVQTPQDAFSIEAEPTSNSLVVACSDENLEVIRELIDALSAQAADLAGASRTELVMLSATPAVEMVQSLRDLYIDRENGLRGERAVGAVPNTRLNAVMLSGSEQDIAEMRRLIGQLDTNDVLRVREVRRIELQSANPVELVGLLNDIFSGRSVAGPGRGQTQATKLTFIRDQLAEQLQGEGGVPPSEAQIDGAIRELVTFTPDVRTNSLIVTAPPKLMTLIADMVADLDTSKRDRKVEIFELQNADARAMAELIRGVFNLRQQGSVYVLVPTEEPEAGGDPSGPSVTPVPDERQQLSIEVDARTNSLVVSGTEKYLELVRGLIQKLDAKDAEEREMIVYHLRNAKAIEIEETLQKLFQGEADLQRDLLGGELSGSVLRQLEQEVTVVGDEKSNKLIVTVAPRYREKVLEIVDELDAAPPQVVIQVLLAEVTADAANTWGVDIKLPDVSGENISATSLAAGAGVATALGVPNLIFSSVDFELLIRALEAQGKLQVLSRPYVTARNNEPASIQVGDNIAIVQGVERLDNGNTRSDVTREDIGIKLEVTPSISPDGFIRLEILPEISTLSQRTTQISEDFLAPVINKRQVSTTVTVRDGQTVVIGGLIQTTQEDRRSKTPGLGDIPLAGWLFRSSQKSDVRTELVVILTPRVIYGDSPEDVERFHRYSESKIDAMQNPDAIRDALEEDGVNEPPPIFFDTPPVEPEVPDPRPEASVRVVEPARHNPIDPR